MDQHSPKNHCGDYLRAGPPIMERAPATPLNAQQGLQKQGPLPLSSHIFHLAPGNAPSAYEGNCFCKTGWQNVKQKGQKTATTGTDILKQRGSTRRTQRDSSRPMRCSYSGEGTPRCINVVEPLGNATDHARKLKRQKHPETHTHT